MGYLLKQRRLGLDDLTAVATAMGAAAVGAFAVGASTIRWLAIGRVAAGNAQVVTLQLQDLAVTRLRVGDVVVTGCIDLPEMDESPKISS
jgi:Na+/H+ antiporter NhaC